MLSYIFRRALLLIPTVIGTSLLIFVLLRLLPGDVVDALGGTIELASHPGQGTSLRVTLPIEDR